MQIVAAVTSKPAITRILEHLGLATAAPSFHAARPPPQTELAFDHAPALDADPPAQGDFGA